MTLEDILEEKLIGSKVKLDRTSVKDLEVIITNLYLTTTSVYGSYSPAIDFVVRDNSGNSKTIFDFEFSEDIEFLDLD